MKAGGNLLLGGRPPTHDETGRPLEEPLLPPGAESVRYHAEESRKVGGESFPGLISNTVLSGRPTLIDEKKQWIGIADESLDKGQIIWTGAWTAGVTWDR